MTKEELKQKCKERAKIFQQAMESCHSSSPMDCIEWFADRIAELEAENEQLTVSYETLKLHDEEEIGMLKSENAELKETVIKMNNVITETFSNLSKAKELLERLLITSCNSDVLNLLPNCSEVLRVRVEAEQFLSEVEK